jgi:hypothetical protein
MGERVTLNFRLHCEQLSFALRAYFVCTVWISSALESRRRNPH